jgi:hypothetical protein
MPVNLTKNKLGQITCLASKTVGLNHNKIFWILFLSSINFKMPMAN